MVPLMEPKSGDADLPSSLTRFGPQVVSSVALVAFAILAVSVFAGAWANPAGAWIGDNGDPKLFIWYVGWIPHELSNWHHPLVTDYLSYPHGVNLMWNSSILFPAFILWPVTALFGPVVAYNVLITCAVALSAWLGFMASQRFIGNAPFCLFTGFVYGFSPGMMAQATGHPHAMIGLFPPIALILAHEILVLQRYRAALLGGLAGLAATLQLLTGEEVLATTALIAAIGVLLVALLHRSSVAEKMPFAIRAVGAAVLSFAILAAYPLAIQFFGPQRVFGDVQTPDVYVSDLLAFVVPNHVWLHNSASEIVSHFTGNSTEDDAYVGLPLLVLFVWGLIAGWRRPSIRWAGLLTVLIAVLSLGPHLHVYGHATPLWLPWAVIAGLPLMGNALPSRLMLPAFLGLGIVVASLFAHPRTMARRWRLGAWVLLVAGLVAVAPAIPFQTTPASVPSFFQSGGGVQGIPDGAAVLVTPFSSHRSTDAMYWQTVAQYRFRMPEGDAFTPGPYLGPHPSHLQGTLDAPDQGQSVVVSTSERAQALGDLAAFGVVAIVVGPSHGRDAIVSYLTSVLGSPPVETGGVDVWWHLPPTA